MIDTSTVFILASSAGETLSLLLRNQVSTLFFQFPGDSHTSPACMRAILSDTVNGAAKVVKKWTDQ